MAENEKTHARIVGALFIIAIVVSIAGGSLIDAALASPEMFLASPDNSTQLITGVLLELINGIAVVGIAIFLYPILRPVDESLAIGYVVLRTVEVVVIVAAVVSPLTLYGLSQGYAAEYPAEVSHLSALAASLMATRAQLVGFLLALFFSLTGLVLYYLLYRSKLVPRFISIWGLIAVVLILSWNFYMLLGYETSFGIFLALPIILNELVLGIWLIVKGFSEVETVSQPEKVTLRET